MTDAMIQNGVDLGLDSSGDLLVDERGDLALVHGTDCLLQDIRHRLETSPGDVFASESFGSKLFSFLGTSDTELNRSLIRRTVESSLKDDKRINPATVQVLLRKYTAEELQLEISFIPLTDVHPLNLIYGLTVHGMELLPR
jgi:phage baseplate assembly protein W